ncbi:sigma-70 family RNA polymerase sigma factor [Flavonifractor sp. An306]|uniref:RNA polymerase sigma factor n=1 Tax=Flavonifractor sp. An306 TaxID=1965629 RepID=UPI0013A6345F|nr:sigma-70 family RNA polymerase sigma factor [Flavonifractor sp. An306]
MGRYEDYNEMLYEAYCKAAIDNAILKARQKKVAHGQRVSPLSDLSDADLFSLADEWEPELPDEPFTYYIREQAIQIKDQKLGQALSSLLPKDREIILLYYFLGLRDEAVAKRLNMSRATVQRRREKAQKKLKTILEENP